MFNANARVNDEPLLEADTVLKRYVPRLWSPDATRPDASLEDTLARSVG
jgi:hypothetical protein